MVVRTGKDGKAKDGGDAEERESGREEREEVEGGPARSGEKRGPHLG